MKTLLLVVVLALAVTMVGAQAFAQGCHGGGTTAPPAGQRGGGGGGAHHAGGQAVDQQVPPAENMLTLIGTVVSIAPNGAALVDTGTAKIYVIADTAPAQDGAAPASPFKVGDQIQVAGVLLALTIQPAEGEVQAQNAQLTQARFRVDNILCGACATSVQQALQAAPGVKQVSVSAAGTATVGYDPAVTNPEALAKVIVGARHPHGGMKFKATLVQ